MRKLRRLKLRRNSPGMKECSNRFSSYNNRLQLQDRFMASYSTWRVQAWSRSRAPAIMRVLKATKNINSSPPNNRLKVWRRSKKLWMSKLCKRRVVIYQAQIGKEQECSLSYRMITDSQFSNSWQSKNLRTVTRSTFTLLMTFDLMVYTCRSLYLNY